MADKNQRFIEIMDSTLRDGEQMQDGSYTSAEKLTIARMLIEDVKVNRVEIASARVSQGEEEAASKVLQWANEAGHAGKIEVLGLIDERTSVQWLTRVGARVMNLLAKGSLIHLSKQLRRSPEEHIEDIQDHRKRRSGRDRVQYLSGRLVQRYVEISGLRLHSPRCTENDIH